MPAIRSFFERRYYFFLLVILTGYAQAQVVDSTEVKPTSGRFIPVYPDRYGDPFSNRINLSPFSLKTPSAIKLDVALDTARNYSIREKIGSFYYRPLSFMTFGEYNQFESRQSLRQYWKKSASALDGESAVEGRSLNPKIYVGPSMDRIFGGSYIEFIPRGNLMLDFGMTSQRINNPSIPVRQQKTASFNFDQQISLNVKGKVGEKLSISTNFDTNSSFDFQNNMKIEYTGFKEDILQKLELGNVSLPLNNTLIQGAQNLFGIKSQMQFGKLKATMIASTQRGKSSSLTIDGGSNGQNRKFELVASNYDENRHFFLSHFFRDHFTAWITNPTQVISGVNITRVEVYVLNRKSDTQTLRNVIGLMDLGEASTIYNSSVSSNGSSMPAANASNSLFDALKDQNRSADGINTILDNFFAGDNNSGRDYEKITGARKLASTEYTFHSQLGYITLTSRLQNDEALAVAYEYTYNGRAYKVGELSEDYSSLKDDEVIFLKLLRPREIAIRDDAKKIIPTWKLMMKNIYSLSATQLTNTGFELRVVYRDDASGIDNPQLQEGTTVRTRQLVEIMGLDKLNTMNDRQADGNFDFVEGVTINSTAGLIIFPDHEPFNTSLRTAFADEPTEAALISKYCYDTLYGTTKTEAALITSKNKFYITGLYTASKSSEIVIPGIGVAENSVKVYAGGIQLSEGVDFVVDYTYGKVTILNEVILTSGKDINVQYEQKDAFSYQTKSLIGARFDYALNEDINFGSTVLYYNERPVISRNAIGNEPARNIQYGFDFGIHKKSRFLTRMVDALPFYQTKGESSVSITGEFAQLIPGTSNIIDGEGTAYIDDFENTATPYSLLSPAAWKLASTPKTINNEFDPSSGAADDIRAGYQRAKLSWYTIDTQLQQTTGSLKPSNITDTDLQNHYIRAIDPTEIFPSKQVAIGVYYETIFNLSYFPSERGPYNYNPSLTEAALLPTPEKSWAGITTAIKTETDFDKANIEYVEFWLLDPFINLPSGNGKVLDGLYNKSNERGGKLIFQLGSVSEDVMRDSRHAFENGLPIDGNLAGAEASSNSWGYVTSNQYLTSSFDNTSSASRANQDVGLDGLPDDKEATYFDSYLNSLNGAARVKVQADPSADNFKHFLNGDYDQQNAQILERYKNYNGMDGNSPLSSGSTTSNSSYLTPDNEDLNADNTLNETEAYYQYDINLKPNGLDIDKEYIVDKITTSETNSVNEAVTWYLFRIPIEDYKSKYGNIDGFKSIKYMRMLMTGFKEPVVLRMANFRMIGSYWRRYTTDDLQLPGFAEVSEPDFDNFTVSVVNLEENGVKDVAANKSAYVIPPGIVRDYDNTSSVSRLLNEQSVQICVDNLKEGEARAIYKNLSVDLFNYGRIKMFLHANSATATNDDLHAFLRLGTDLTANYYEIEIPLKISDAADASDRGVWPEENEIDLALDELYTLKVQRDRENFSLLEVYPRAGPKQVGHHLLRIMGRPDLSSVVSMMIAVRNPISSDQKSFSACVWANELRVTDFDRTAGWAVNAAANIKLSDLATINGVLRYTTYGYGAVSSKISERTRDETMTYDLSTNVNLEKLLPEKLGLKIPVYASYENTLIKPQYDPANPDVRIDAALNAFSTEEEKNNYLNIVQGSNERRSLSFTNVRKVKTKKDAVSYLWDVENLSLSYSYSDAMTKSFEVVAQEEKYYKGSVAYNFSPKVNSIEPFKNSKTFSSPWLKLIKEFNFNLLPSNLMVRSDLNRSFNKTIYRNSGSDGSFIESDPNYIKYFTMVRQYAVRWNLTRNLSLDYSSTANAVIDEPEGDIDGKVKRDSVIANLKKGGRMKNFSQTISAGYTLPLDKLPATEWMGADYRYQTNYTWTAGTYNKPDSLVKAGESDLADSLDFKNTIANNRTQNFSGKADMLKLYNKLKFLKEINTPASAAKKTNPSAKPAANQPVATAGVPGLVKGVVRLIMSVRSIQATYTLTESIILPGFEGTPLFFGMDKSWGAPGWDFVLGGQSTDMRFKAANENLIVKSSSLTTQFVQSKVKNINLRASLEPSSTFKIQLEARKETTDAYSEIFRYNPDEATTESGFASLSPSRSGSYRISAISIGTAFSRSNSKINSSVFHQFESNLETIKNRFTSIQNVEYDTASQDVLIPAFISAYTGKDANTVALTPFTKTPLPNWRVDYTGLSQLGVLKDIFQSVSISHSYQSSYSVGSYVSSLEYTDVNKLGINRSVEDYNATYFGTTSSGSTVPMYVISQVSISERFAPLIGVNVRTRKKLTANLQYKTGRDVLLTISNAQITETTTRDISCEMGITKNNMKLPFKTKGRIITIKNDITMRLNASVSETRTIQRKINDVNTLTAGSLTFQLRPNVTYAVNKRLSLQFYFTSSHSNPYTSGSYRNVNNAAGVQLRFNLAEL